MKDFRQPTALVIHRVPKAELEAQYKIVLPATTSKRYTTSTFLQLVAGSRGHMTGSGLPNQAIAAR